MSKNELMRLLDKAVEEHGQAEVSRRIGYSSSAVSQVRNGKYLGDSAAVLRRVEEVFGSSTVICPVLGEIPLCRCANERSRVPRYTNPIARQLSKICPNCKEYGG
jgi:transcriptional regulator with XRE-family HTH domain